MGMFDDLMPAKSGGMFDDLMPKKQMDTELTWAEKNIAPLLPKALGDLAGGNVRGSAVGRLAMGAADPGVAVAQIAANLTGQGDAVNKGIVDTEKQYQSDRASAGSTGFDPLRLAGGVAMTLPLGGAGAAAAKTLPGAAALGAAQGAGFSALQPINEGGEGYWMDKLKQTLTGAAIGGAAAPAMSVLSRAVNPAVNPNVKALQDVGVQPTIGQAAGGWLNRLEDKAQSVPILGDAIRTARERGAGQLEAAAFQRAGDPVGAKITGRGFDGILEAKDALSASYDKVIPKLSADVLDPVFVNKMANLRGLVSNLPQRERDRFDSVISREIDDRLAPNGRLSGQNLKDAWNALRDEAAKFSKSDDAYQQDLGRAFKQAFQELKDHVSATNNAADVRTLKNTDLGYANFKILQRAASGVNSVDGAITPSALQSAVRASDRSLDKGRMAEGRALLQDLSNAGKDVLTNKVPNSGTFDRLMTGSVAGLGVGLATSPLTMAYTPLVQNALVALMTKRPDMAPKIANYLKQLSGPVTAGAVLGQQ